MKPFTVVDGPDAWTADQWKTDKSFIHTLSDAEIVELDAAVARNADVDEIQVSLPAHSTTMRTCCA